MARFRTGQAVRSTIENNVEPTEPQVVSTSRAALGRGANGAAGIAGIVYVACLMMTPPDGPSMATATAQQVREHVSAQGSAIQAAAFAGMIGVAAALVFYAALTKHVRNFLPESILADVVLASGVVVVMYQWLLVTAEAMTSLLPNLIGSDLKSVDDATLLGWFGLTAFTHFLGDLALVPVVIAVASFSLAALRAGFLPRWLTWAGLVLAGSGVLGMIAILVVVDALYPFWFVTLFGYVLWVAAIGIFFLVRARSTRHGANRKSDSIAGMGNPPD